MNTPRNLSRRQLLKAAGASVAVVFSARSASAADDLPLLEADDSNAVARGYVTNSGDRAKRCGACEQYRGLPNGNSGPCITFPDNTVMNNGWCSAFMPVPQ